MGFFSGVEAASPWSGLAIDVILKVTLVLTVAALACLALRRGSASIRHLIWAVAVTGAGVIPILSLAVPAWRIPILPTASTSKTAAALDEPRTPLPRVASTPSMPDLERSAGEPGPIEPALAIAPIPASPQAPASGSWLAWLAPVWLLGASLVMGPMIFGQVGLGILRRRSPRLAAGPCAELSEQLRRQLGISRSVELLRGGAVASPMSWGVFRPRILLPGSAESWPGDRLRNVILHELAHVKRWDCLTQIVARLACAAYWFHPLVWVAWSRILIERELACDDLVLRSGSHATDYAGHLLDVARTLRSPGRFAVASVPMARTSRIEGRLRAILDGSRDRRVVGRRSGWLVLGSVAALLIPLSTARLGARAADQGSESKAQPGDMMVVSGRVVDPGGKPLFGAHVAIVGRRKLAFLNARADDQHQALGQTQADPSGNFRLEVARTSSVSYYEAHVLASSPGFGLGWTEIDRDAASPVAEVRLRPEQVVEGQLVDLQGAPAPGVNVRIASVGVTREELGRFDGLSFHRATPKGLEAVWLDPVRTDDEGRFRLSGIGRGVRVGLSVDHPRYARQSLSLMADSKPATLVLRPAVQITGRVTGGDTREPIRDAIVQVGTGSSEYGLTQTEYRTDSQGNYTANPGPGKYLSVTVYPPVGSPYLIFGRTFKEDDGPTRRVVDLAVPRGVLIAGQITVGHGKPLSGASVYYDNGTSNIIEGQGTIPGWMAAVPSGPDGRYAIAVAPGKGALVAYGPTADFVHQIQGESEIRGGKPGGRRKYAHAFVPYEAKMDRGSLAIDLPLKPGVTVVGRVEGPDGQTVDEAEIVSTLSISPFHTTWRGDFTIPVRNGRFELHGVPLDRSVRCSFLDARNGWGTTIEVNASMAASGPIVVKLERSGTARARMVDEQGRPIERGVVNLNIVASPGPGTNFSSQSLTLEEKGLLAADEEIYANVDRRNYWKSPRTDAEGRIALPFLIPGATYRIYQYTPDFGKDAYRWRDFTVGGGQTLDLGDIRVQAPRN